MPNTKPVNIPIRADTTKAENALRRVGAGLKSLTPSFNQMRNVALAGTAALVGLGAGAVAIAKSTADAGDAIQKMSLRLGIAAGTLSQLKFAAEISGASLDDIEKSMK